MLDVSVRTKLMLYVLDGVSVRNSKFGSVKRSISALAFDIRRDTFAISKLTDILSDAV